MYNNLNDCCIIILITVNNFYKTIVFTFIISVLDTSDVR